VLVTAACSFVMIGLKQQKEKTEWYYWLWIEPRWPREKMTRSEERYSSGVEETELMQPKVKMHC